jgi:hypothetical protein
MVKLKSLLESINLTESVDDVAYMKAVEDGDMDAVQKMVDAAAKSAGYGIRVKRGDGRAFNSFDKARRGDSTKASSAKKAFFFTTSDSAARTFARMSSDNESEVSLSAHQKELTKIADAHREPAMRRMESEARSNTSGLSSDVKEVMLMYIAHELESGLSYIADKNNYFNSEDVKKWAVATSQITSIHRPDWVAKRDNRKSELGLSDTGVVRDFYLNMGNYETIDYNGHTSRSGEEMTYSDAIDVAVGSGKDGILLRNTHDAGEVIDIYAVFDPSQIKSADSVTKDDDGHVVPLSKRFAKGTLDIRNEVTR